MQPQFYGAAANYNRPKTFGLRQILMIAGLVVFVIILLAVGSALVSSLTSGSRNNLATLIIREQQITSFIDANIKDVQNGDIRKISSDAILLLKTDAVAMQKQMSSAYGQSKLPDDIVKREVDTTSANDLKAAQQISRYDSKYHEILRDKLAAALTIAETVQAESNGTLKTAVDQTIKNMMLLDEQLKTLKP